MFHHHAKLVVVRDFILLASLVLLAGCNVPEPPPLSAVAAPTNLIAIAGNAQVSLAWTASNGATSYSVKRAITNFGPYTRLASSTSTTYMDSSVINGTTYYYVVSAVDAAGEGADSAQATATPSAAIAPPPTTFGTWTNVTPSGVDLGSALCSNFGASTVQTDPMNPSNLYTQFNCQGVWKSTDYGATWSGPINTGTNGALVNDCSGGIAIASSSTASIPAVYQSCIRGIATGFWKSANGGVDWTNYVVLSSAARQDYLPPAIDPYDDAHLLMTAHEFDSLVESFDGGLTWASVSLNNGMLQNASNSTVFFVNTGNPSTTRGTWLWTGGSSGGAGTWRTVNSGVSWTRVDKNEGTAQIYQPDNNGVIYLAGTGSDLGQGVLRSSDYGQQWTHVGSNTAEAIVFGTSKNVYSMFGYPVGPTGSINPAFQAASQPGTGIWVSPGTPVGLTQGPNQVGVVNDGDHNIFVGAMFNGGLWRYIEP